GVATADLRGLGPNRTLVLVDGVRLGIGSPYTVIQQPAPDLDQIPTFLVDRIEVVTGGASATYGSDAIAGVINFIMKKNFEGQHTRGPRGRDHPQNPKSLPPAEDAAFFWKDRRPTGRRRGRPQPPVRHGPGCEFCGQ